jgi:hypothetical protein
VQVLQVGPAQDMLPTRIHCGNMIVSGEAWRQFKESHPERDFTDFWLEISLKFSMNCFDLSLFFLLHKEDDPATTTSSSSNFVKTEPLSPMTDEHDFAYASDITENNSRDPGHVVELSF